MTSRRKTFQGSRAAKQRRKRCALSYLSIGDSRSIPWHSVARPSLEDHVYQCSKSETAYVVTYQEGELARETARCGKKGRLSTAALLNLIPQSRLNTSSWP